MCFWFISPVISMSYCKSGPSARTGFGECAPAGATGRDPSGDDPKGLDPPFRPVERSAGSLPGTAEPVSLRPCVRSRCFSPKSMCPKHVSFGGACVCSHVFFADMCILDHEGESGALFRAGKLDGGAMVREFADDRRPQSAGGETGEKAFRCAERRLPGYGPVRFHAAGDLVQVAERLLPEGRRPGGWASRLGRTTRDRSVGHGIGFTAAAASAARRGAFGAEGSGLRYRSGCGRPSSCSASLFSSGQERTSVL